MVSFLIYLFCFLVLFFISKQEYKTLCFLLVSLISVQLVLSYYANTERIHDILFYLVSLSFIDLVMVLCCISNSIRLKQHSLWISGVALVSVFCTLLCIFDYYNFYYFLCTYVYNGISIFLYQATTKTQSCILCLLFTVNSSTYDFIKERLYNIIIIITNSATTPYIYHIKFKVTNNENIRSIYGSNR